MNLIVIREVLGERTTLWIALSYTPLMRHLMLDAPIFAFVAVLFGGTPGVVHVTVEPGLSAPDCIALAQQGLPLTGLGDDGAIYFLADAIRACRPELG